MGLLLTACGTQPQPSEERDANLAPAQVAEQRLTWSFAGNTAGFGREHLKNQLVFIGNFNGGSQDDILFYNPGDDNWFLGSHGSDRLRWSFAGNTTGFGRGHLGVQRTFVGDFNGDRRDDILFYNPGDDNWWLGSYGNGKLNWTFVSNTTGFGRGHLRTQLAFKGDFNSGARDDILFYNPGDDNWWLGSYENGRLNWTFAGNTTGFGRGHLRNQLVFIGDFNGGARDDVLFYHPGDDNWWLGSHNGSSVLWSFAGNTTGFGRGHLRNQRTFVGDFNGGGRDDILFYNPGDDNWWLGSHRNSRLRWAFAGNTTGFGRGHLSTQLPFVGNFNGGWDDVLFYNPGDDNWWLGSHRSGRLRWAFGGNTTGFGRGHLRNQTVFIGDFDGGGRDDVLFYNPGDDNWWLGSVRF